MDAISETQANTVPQVKGGVVPYLQVDGAMKAAEFYQRAFGLEPSHRLDFPDFSLVYLRNDESDN